MTDTTRGWIHGLAAAAIGGSAGSFATICVAPDKFNLESMQGLRHVCLVAIITGAMNAAAYLKQSPLPTPMLSPGDQVKLQNPTMSPDGTIQADGATLLKGPAEATKP